MRPWSFALLALVACDSAPTDGLLGRAPDAHAPGDAAAEQPDAGAADGAAPDALARPDAAEDTDAGPASDAGPPTFHACGAIGFGTLTRAVPSPDGRHLALATVSGEVVLTSTVDGAIVTRIAAHEGRAVDAAFSPDGAHLYTWGHDRTLRAWSVPGGAPEWSARKPRGDVDARLAVDGDRVAVGGPPAIVFHARTGAVIRTLDHPGVGARIGYDPGLVALQPGTDRIAVAQGETVYLFDSSGAPRELTGDLGTVDTGAYAPEIQSLAFTPDGRHLLVATRRAYFSTSGRRYPVARLYDVATGAILTTLTADSSYGVSAALSSDGRSVAVTAGHVVDQWAVFGPDGAFLGDDALTALRLGSSAAEIRYDARGRIVAREDGHRVHLHAPGAPTPDLTLRAGTPSEGPLALLDDDTLLRTSGGRTVELWSIAEPRQRRTLAHAVRAAAASPDGARLAIVRPDGVDLLDLTTPGATPVRTSTLAFGRALAFDAAGTTLAIAADRDARSGHQPGVLAVVRARDGAPLGATTTAGPVEQLRWTASGWLTVPPSRDRYRGPHVYELWSRALPLTRTASLALEGGGVDSADVSADGATLLAAGWFMPTRGLALPSAVELPLPSDLRAARIRFAASGDLLAMGDVRGELRLGPPDRPGEGALLGPALAGEITRLDFSPSGRTLVVATAHGDTHVFCADAR